MSELTQYLRDADAAQIAEAVGNLPVGKQREVRDAASSVLPPAPAGIWYMLLGGLLVLAAGFGFLAFELIHNGHPAEALIALATTAMGAVAGLLAPSPLGR